MNVWIGTGRLASNVEKRTLDSGNRHYEFRFAVRRARKGPDGEKMTDFFSVECWNNAGNALKYLRKGSYCGIVGRLEQDAVQRDGEMRYYTKIIATQIDLAPKEAATRAVQDEMDGYVGMMNLSLVYCAE